jgi:hypothetical protein
MMKRLAGLILEGDWACAAGDADCLSRVCAALAALLPPEQLDAVLSISEVANEDMREAASRWGKLASSMRTGTTPALWQAASRCHYRPTRARVRGWTVRPPLRRTAAEAASEPGYR